MEQYLDHIKSAFAVVSFTPELEAFFVENCTVRAYPRNTIITAAGVVERYLFLVLSGVQSLYLIDRRGELVILGFSYQGNFSGVFHSYLSQQPSDFFLEAHTDSLMLCIPLSAYQHLMDHYNDFNTWGRLFFQNMLIGRVTRETELLTLPAKERYDQFMARCPDELRTIPQKYLASYLNMTPETFSRMRRKG
jgi:CRP-like cAMP-binding protein